MILKCIETRQQFPVLLLRTPPFLYPPINLIIKNIQLKEKNINCMQNIFRNKILHSNAGLLKLDFKHKLCPKREKKFKFK